MGTKRLVDVVTSAYQLGKSDDEWLGSMLEAARDRLDRGLGVMAYTYQASPTDIRFGRVVACGGAEPVFERLARCVLHEDPYVQRYLYLHGGACTTSSQVFRMRKEFEQQPFFRDRFHALGVRDFLGVNATDPTGAGVMITAPLGAVQWAPRTMQRHWGRAAAHIAAAFRLRRALGTTSPMREAAAILRPDGRVEHAERDATERRAREALQQAVSAREHARAAGEDEALGAWTALVRGRWSVIDFFDSDGKRFVVARRNDPAVAESAALTELEAQVLGLARLGHGHKLVAYELGLPMSTVVASLQRALRKIGLRSRNELIRALGPGAEKTR